MRQLSITIDILAPAERVWTVLIDLDRWPEWTPSMTSLKRLDEGPLVVGSRVEIKQPKFPPARWTVTAIEPGQSFSWASVGPGLRVVGHHAIEPTATGSRVRLWLDFQGIFGSVWGRLTRGITERYLALEAQGLKSRSEETVDPAELTV